MEDGLKEFCLSPRLLEIFMIWLLVTQGLALLLDILMICCSSQTDKDLELLLLRHQLRILQRKSSANARLNRAEKLTLVTLLAKFKQRTRQTCQQLSGLDCSS
jgi:hypothetical protein